MAARGMAWPTVYGKDKDQDLKNKPLTSSIAGKRNGPRIAHTERCRVPRIGLAGSEKASRALGCCPDSQVFSPLSKGQLKSA
jgi:hypothetical protein